ncbi:DivIVA domain-containing protein [Actinomycetes bacterium KLBMP 9797]
MTLTPPDVRNVTFSKSGLNKRGYEEEDVDAFLEELQQDLALLIEENNHLRAQLTPAGAPADPDGDRRLAAQIDHVTAQLHRAQRDKATTERAARELRAELERAHGQNGPASDSDLEHQAHPMLMMATRTADDHIADARHEAKVLLAEARSQADEVTRDARTNSAALESDARQRHQQAIATLAAMRAAALKQIKELEGFQHEYRTQLKAYLQSQIRELDGRGVDPPAAD